MISRVRSRRFAGAPTLRRWCVLVCSAGLVAGSAWGSAFSIAEQGTKATEMGALAYTGIADDGSGDLLQSRWFRISAGECTCKMDAMAVVGLFRYTPPLTPPGTVVPSNGYSGSIKHSLHSCRHHGIFPNRLIRNLRSRSGFMFHTDSPRTLPTSTTPTRRILSLSAGSPGPAQRCNLIGFSRP